MVHIKKAGGEIQVFFAECIRMYCVLFLVSNKKSFKLAFVVMRNLLRMTSKYLPNNDDFLGAQRSLIRLQHTYHLQTVDISNGLVTVHF